MLPGEGGAVKVRPGSFFEGRPKSLLKVPSLFYQNFTIQRLEVNQTPPIKTRCTLRSSFPRTTTGKGLESFSGTAMKRELRQGFENDSQLRIDFDSLDTRLMRTTAGI